MSNPERRVAVGGATGSGRRSIIGCLMSAGDSLPTFISGWASVAEAAELFAAASWPERGLVVVDAVAGVQTETAADVNLLTGLGISELVVAVNRMDLTDFSEARFREIEEICRGLGDATQHLHVVPVAAVGGVNISEPSARMSFHSGPTLAALLGSAPQRTNGGEIRPPAADAFRVAIAWTGAEPLLPGRAYTLSLGDQSETATVAPLRYRIELITGEHTAASTLGAGEIGVCDVELARPLVPPRRPNEGAAHFRLHDRMSGAPVGIGVIRYPLRRSDTVRWQSFKVGKAERAARLGQRPTVLWLTGLSGAGKSTVANLVEAELHRRGHHTYLLDGDNVRHGLNADLGFTPAARVENIRRVAEVARLMADAGLIVIVSFISPFRAERSMARERLEPGEFFEVWVDAPLAVAEQRDPKGLYARARRGELTNFTGIDSPYEPPDNPEVHLETAHSTPSEAVAQVLDALERAGRIAKRDR